MTVVHGNAVGGKFAEGLGVEAGNVNEMVVVEGILECGDGG